MAFAKERTYTMKDMPEGERAELIDGKLYYTAPFAVFLNSDGKTLCRIPHLYYLKPTVPYSY